MIGDRMLASNATGCSSIYSGNLPTTPWSTDAAGRGPAWSNSLFEDNAEFGLGMRLGADAQRDEDAEPDPLWQELRNEATLPAIYMPPTTDRLPVPIWDQLHLINPWLYDPGIYDFTYDPGIPPVPRGTTTPRRPTTPTTPTAPRRPSPGSSGTTRPTPQNQTCRKPFIYDATTKKCVLPPCPEGQAFSISQNKCVPIPQLTAADEVKEPFPWWLVVLIGTGLVIATSRPKK